MASPVSEFCDKLVAAAALLAEAERIAFDNEGRGLTLVDATTVGAMRNQVEIYAHNVFTVSL